jgi:hypothetical protein
MKKCYSEYGMRLLSEGTGAASPIEATSSTDEQKLKWWTTVVEQFVFQYVT